MKTKPHVGPPADTKSQKPLEIHGLGRERRRLILDEGLPYSHRHAAWASIATLLERRHHLRPDVFAAPHHAQTGSVDVAYVVGSAVELASQPAFSIMIKALAERISFSLGQSVLGSTEERLREAQRLVDARLLNLEERVSRLETLATPRVSEPESGDPFQAFQELRREIGEERFGWIVRDD